MFDFGFSSDSELADIKVPPHSIEAEQSVLGGLMIANDAWDNVADQLNPSDFYRGSHRQIFTQMEKLVEAGEPVDVITLSEALNNNDQLEQSGGLPYLAGLANNTPSAANIRAYAKVVRERSSLRSLINVANDIVDSGYNTEGRDSDDLLDEAERKIMQISEERPKLGGPQAVNPLLKGAVDRIDELFNSESTLTGISTGFTELDEKTSGLQRSDLIIVAARPSMGKTAFAVNLVEHAVLNNDKPVIVFSMEMPASAIIMRMISAIGRIPLGKVLTGKLDEEDWPKLTSAVSKLKDRPLFIDDTPSLSPTEIRSRTRRIAREHGDVAMIMVDYLQLMQVAGSSEGRTAEISEISRSLKAIAKEFNCPVVALSQLNRSLEQRPNKRPINSDLRESGAIEQDADVIMFIYRDEYYNEDSADKGIAEIIIGKQRNGPTGTSRLAFIGHFTRFDNLAFNYGDDNQY
ncbi:replicative DNA helicase [marine gamma proteobacterium HTCC2143]|uniref:Replicative DNA helicase n=1 Tax=marine gamma proteobacterium HTCC2143 TaxID=247633 RepID=A0Y7I9_9GAMM|nr:replicative DNA helicase [marine gamma proteobacterium HTCC2143]